MTRREWLQKNPPPQPAGPLLERAGQLESEVSTQVEWYRTQSTANPANAATYNAEITRLLAPATAIRKQAASAGATCSLHAGVALNRHLNRPEDLFICERGPHFLLWTLVGGRAQLVPLAALKDLPEIDALMSGA
jgi:hypothetical protein